MHYFDRKKSLCGSRIIQLVNFPCLSLGSRSNILLHEPRDASPHRYSSRHCSEQQLMKSVMACTPLNSISQGSTICLNGLLLLPSRYHCKIHPDLNVPDDVCSQWCSFVFTSKTPLKSYSQILTAALLSLLHSLLSIFV